MILSTGARWRQMNVPGEDEYRNKGVAYCPHCDGPLFKGKRVAVIGGGNSGVEAAIDLAGIVAPRDADRVRRPAARRRGAAAQAAQPAQRHGDHLGADHRGASATARRSPASPTRTATGDEQHRIELEGIFVQIGLVPNTEWLKGTVELSPRGEIEVDARGQTSVPGVFAAGDATTVPYKQIVIAMGEGSKAALSAFDHLIRSTPVEVKEAAKGLPGYIESCRAAQIPHREVCAGGAPLQWPRLYMLRAMIAPLECYAIRRMTSLLGTRGLD